MQQRVENGKGRKKVENHWRRIAAFGKKDQKKELQRENYESKEKV